jgi:ketosteroid isomerase-like protein
MNWILLIFISAIFISCSDPGKSENFSVSHINSPREIDSSIRHLEIVEWGNATAKKDTLWFQRHIAEELIMTTGRTGEVTNKKQTIDEIKDPSYGSGSEDKLEDLKIISFENTAIATFKISTHGKDKTGPYFRIARYTEVWVFNDNRWQLIASHSSLTP